MVLEWFCLKSYVLFVIFFFSNRGSYELDWFIQIFTMFSS